MSTSQTERKPSVSTWFSSLRRHPKPKKVLASKKQLQKSCVDLSSIPNDVKSLPASATNSPKVKNAFFRDNFFCLSPLKSRANGNVAMKSKSIDSDEKPKSPLPNTSTKSRTYSTASYRSNGSSSSSGVGSNKGQTSTISTTTKITKTTVIVTTQALSHRINRIGTIFDDDGQLISNLDVYKSYTDSFRSNIMKNDSGSSCNSGSQPNILHSHHINNNSVAKSKNCNATVRFDDNSDKVKTTINDTKTTAGGTAISYISIGDSDSGTSCKKSASNNSITIRPFKSSSLNLDDDIEFIDTSSSLSDIGGSGGLDSHFGSIENTSMYYNTLPKLPKTCATCKTQQQQQKQQSKSEWNISIHNKTVTQRLDLSLEKDSIFYKLGSYGLISFSDYIFLLTVLSTSRRHFEIAFRHFDLNGDGDVDSDEFEKVATLVQKQTSIGSRHRDHANTGNTFKGVNSALTTYFFGKKMDKKLTIEKFLDFQQQIQREILQLEFRRKNPNDENKISESDFAELLLAYAGLSVKRKSKKMKRVKKRFRDHGCGISLKEYLDFFHFLNNINDVDTALTFYHIAGASIDQATLKHVAKTVAHVELSDHVVDVVFTIFDENMNNQLSNREFVAVMKNRLLRGLEKPKDTGFVKLIHSMLKCAKDTKPVLLDI